MSGKAQSPPVAERVNSVLLLPPPFALSWCWNLAPLSGCITSLPPCSPAAPQAHPILQPHFSIFSYSSFGQIICTVHSDKFPLSPFSLLYPGAFCFCWLFSKLRILTFLPRGPLWQQPLIFLSLVCCIKISKGVVSESVNPVIYDDCSGSSLAGRIEQNTSIPRETKS